MGNLKMVEGRQFHAKPSYKRTVRKKEAISSKVRLLCYTNGSGSKIRSGSRVVIDQGKKQSYGLVKLFIGHSWKNRATYTKAYVSARIAK